MKKLILTLLIPAFLSANASLRINPIDEIVKALSTGKATELSRYVDGNVDLTILGKTDNYSRAQATMVLQHFFKNNRVKGFELKQNAANGANQFCIGTLQTQSGIYRTVIFLSAKNGKPSIRELRFLPS